MKHPIDPKVDCVFKALLGSIENSNLLINFLNAMLADELPNPIHSVEILNPYNDKEFLDDKLSIVDVKAKDGKSQLYQIEIQLLNHSYLPERILYTWTDIYSQQLKESDKYLLLKPTYSIWLLGENILKTDKQYLHTFKMRDKQGKALTVCGGIWLFELKKFTTVKVIDNQQRWLKFFQEAESFNETNLPPWMHTQEMEQAMTTLQRFSEKEADYFAYQARQNYLRVQNAMLEDRDEALHREEIALQAKEEALQREAIALKAKEAERQAKEAERQAKEAERQAKEAERQAKEVERQAKEDALKEVERLKALLNQKDLH